MSALPTDDSDPCVAFAFTQRRKLGRLWSIYVSLPSELLRRGTPAVEIHPERAAHGMNVTSW
jgi:hypothetical protein